MNHSTGFASVWLEALPVDDGGTGLIVLLFGNPHLLEGGQGGQDGATDPDGVFTLRGRNYLKAVNRELQQQQKHTEKVTLS